MTILIAHFVRLKDLIARKVRGESILACSEFVLVYIIENYKQHSSS